MRAIIIAVAATALLLAGCGSPAPVPAPAHVRMTVEDADSHVMRSEILETLPTLAACEEKLVLFMAKVDESVANNDPATGMMHVRIPGGVRTVMLQGTADTTFRCEGKAAAR